jgi:hypothetical protein
MSFTHGLGGDAPAMIVGVNAFRGLSYLTIDNLHGTVTFGANENFKPDPASVTVTSAPLRWINDLPVADLTIDNRMTYSAILDTGGDYGILLPRMRAAELGYWKPGKEQLTTSHGLGGASLAAQYEVKQIKIGDAAFNRTPGRTELIGPEVAGGNVLLGNVVLRRHRVTFDFKQNLLWLER